MIKGEFSVKDGQLTVSEDELIRLRNEYHRKMFIYDKEKNGVIRDFLQELIDTVEELKKKR